MKLRFRAWDEDEKCFYYSDDDLGNFFSSFSYCDITQSTGLFDKNNKEVYDSDIVKCQQGCTHKVIYVYDIGGEYGGGMPGFVLSGLIRNCGRGYAWTGEEEVMGNVYQNPELLK